jgi:hypothetical protein
MPYIVPIKPPETVCLIISRFIREYYNQRRTGAPGSVLGQRFAKLLNRSGLHLEDILSHSGFIGIHRVMGIRGNSVFYPLDAWNRLSAEEREVLKFSADHPRKDLKKLKRDIGPPDGGFKFNSGIRSISMRDLDKENTS